MGRERCAASGRRNAEAWNARREQVLAARRELAEEKRAGYLRLLGPDVKVWQLSLVESAVTSDLEIAALQASLLLGKSSSPAPSELPRTQGQQLRIFRALGFLAANADPDPTDDLDSIVSRISEGKGQ